MKRGRGVSSSVLGNEDKAKLYFDHFSLTLLQPQENLFSWKADSNVFPICIYQGKSYVGDGCKV